MSRLGWRVLHGLVVVDLGVWVVVPVSGLDEDNGF